MRFSIRAGLGFLALSLSSPAFAAWNCEGLARKSASSSRPLLPELLMVPAEVSARGGPAGFLAFDSEEGFRPKSGAWYFDANNELWFVKRDPLAAEQQVASSLIAGGVYRHFGFVVPDSYKVVADGEPYLVVRRLGGPREEGLTINPRLYPLMWKVTTRLRNRVIRHRVSGKPLNLNHLDKETA